MGEDNACNAGDAGDTGSIPGSGRSPVEGNDYSLQYSCLENPMDRGSWKVTSIGCKELDVTEHTHITLLVFLVFSYHTFLSLQFSLEIFHWSIFSVTDFFFFFSRLYLTY